MTAPFLPDPITQLLRKLSAPSSGQASSASPPGAAPSPYQPITPAGKASLDRVIGESDADKAGQQQTFNNVTKSGISDTLQALLGPHAFGVDSSLIGTDRIAENNMAHRISFNPVALDNFSHDQQDQQYRANRGVPVDTAFMAPSAQASQTLAHEFGHTAEHAPALFPDSTDQSGQNVAGNGQMGPRNLYSQWYQIVSKKADMRPDNRLGLTHQGWTPNRGGEEMFADAFSSAINLLRKSSQTNMDLKEYTKELQTIEKSNPGTIYLSKWLKTQPLFRGK